MKHILITGGAGFIGSHVVRLFVTKYPDYRIVNFDKLTYAGNLENLTDVEQCPNYCFVKGDICDSEQVEAVMRQHAIDGIIHLAAESHVDRSITDPLAFARTNVLGTLTLLQAARTVWGGNWEGAGGSTTSRPTRCTAHCRSTEGASRRRPVTIRTAPTAPARRRATISYAPSHDTYGLPTIVTQQLQQLRPLSVSRETDPALYQQHPPQPAAARVRTGRECARLALCGGSRPAQSIRSFTGAASARPTTSAAATSGATWRSCMS